MAEVAAGAYAVEHLIEGAGAAVYGVAKSTLPLKGRWRQIGTDLPLPRSYHSLVVVTGKAYIFGGETADRKLADNHVHVYSLPSGDIEATDYNVIQSEHAPPPRAGHTAVAIDQFMYVFGGRGAATGTDDDAKPLDEAGRIWCFDTRINKWTHLDPVEGDPFPKPRSGHTSAATEHPLPSKAQGLDGEAAASLEEHGTVFIHAGRLESGQLMSDLWSFDILARNWRRLPDAPGPGRSGTVMTCTSKRLYRYGGYDDQGELGGRVDALTLGKETFVDQAGMGEAAVVPSRQNDGKWTTIKSEKPESPLPGNRSAAGLHHITTGQGRAYLILLLGERTPPHDASSDASSAAAAFWDDVWAFQVQPDGMSAASFKDAARMAVGMKTREYEWAKVQIPESTKTEVKPASPGARGQFASYNAVDIDTAGIVLWGGRGADGGLADGYTLLLETA